MVIQPKYQAIGQSANAEDQQSGTNNCAALFIVFVLVILGISIFFGYLPPFFHAVLNFSSNPLYYSNWVINTLIVINIVSFIIVFLTMAILQLSGGSTSSRNHSRSRRWSRWDRRNLRRERIVSSRDVDSISSSDSDESSVPWIDESQADLPDWLIPLLKHQQVCSPPKLSKLTLEQLIIRITELEAKVVQLQKQLTNTKTSKVLDANEMAIKVLLAALEVQREKGRITEAFYERKRSELISKIES